MNSLLMEIANLKQGNLVTDMDTPITGARVSMAKGDKLAIVVSMGDSTAAVVDLTIQQHNAASAGTSKALATANPYYHKAGAATSFTKVEPGSAVSNYVLSTQFASQEGIAVFEVLGDQLDVDGGFAWVSINAADSTALKNAAILYILRDSRYMPAYGQAL